MATFQWEGENAGREFKKGEMEAPGAQAVRMRLARMGISPARIKKKPSGFWKKMSFSAPAPPKSSIIVFARQLSAMADAGMPIVKCFDLLCQKEKNREFRYVLESVRDQVERGETLAGALAGHPACFDSMFSNMAAAGERGGVLGEMLMKLARHLEKREKLRKKVGAAMIYPLATLLVSLAASGIILVFVIPMFRKMFEDMGGQIPLATQVVLALSDYVKSGLWHILGGGLVLGLGLRRFFRTPKGRLFADEMKLKIPVFGPLSEKTAMAHFSGAMGAMLKSGVAILEAMGAVAGTIGNRAIQAACETARAEVAEGRSLAGALGDSPLFPDMVSRMIRVGESTGELDAVFEKIAEFYHDEADMAAERVASFIEPVMMVFLGITVGGLIVSLYLPVFRMASVLN